MIKRLRTMEAVTDVPYENIALEAYLLRHVKPEECILYLWQNRRTVVIGRNQNSWKECKCELLEKEGGYLARRLSGGGAVFQDLGNLNFTFLMQKEDYDVKRQTQVIVEAAKMYGIQVEHTGRNDIVVEGKKFSGNAYYQSGNCRYHHGTILIRADMEAMSRYLNVPKDKLQSKGIDSVKSRVANLAEYAPQITVEGMKERLITSCSQLYGLRAEVLEKSELDGGEIRRLTESLSSWDWLYGRKIPFTYEVERRFPWGGVQLQLEVAGGAIRSVNLFSDGLEVELIDQMKEGLAGLKFQKEVLLAAVLKLPGDTRLTLDMKSDIAGLLSEMG